MSYPTLPEHPRYEVGDHSEELDDIGDEGYLVDADGVLLRAGARRKSDRVEILDYRLSYQPVADGVGMYRIDRYICGVVADDGLDVDKLERARIIGQITGYDAVDPLDSLAVKILKRVCAGIVERLDHEQDVGIERLNTCDYIGEIIFEVRLDIVEVMIVAIVVVAEKHGQVLLQIVVAAYGHKDDIRVRDGGSDVIPEELGEKVLRTVAVLREIGVGITDGIGDYPGVARFVGVINARTGRYGIAERDKRALRRRYSGNERSEHDRGEHQSDDFYGFFHKDHFR